LAWFDPAYEMAKRSITRRANGSAWSDRDMNTFFAACKDACLLS